MLGIRKLANLGFNMAQKDCHSSLLPAYHHVYLRSYWGMHPLFHWTVHFRVWCTHLCVCDSPLDISGTGGGFPELLES